MVNSKKFRKSDLLLVTLFLSCLIGWFVILLFFVKFHIVTPLYVVTVLKVESVQRYYETKKVQEESTIEWYDYQKKYTEQLRRLVQEQAMLLSSDQKYLERNSRLTAQQIFNVLKDSRKSFFEIYRLYRTEVERLNIAMMRNCHGLQYRDVETLFGDQLEVY